MHEEVNQSEAKDGEQIASLLQDRNKGGPLDKHENGIHTP